MTRDFNRIWYGFISHCTLVGLNTWIVDILDSFLLLKKKMFQFLCSFPTSEGLSSQTTERQTDGYPKSSIWKWSLTNVNKSISVDNKERDTSQVSNELLVAWYESQFNYIWGLYWEMGRGEEGGRAGGERQREGIYMLFGFFDLTNIFWSVAFHKG